ncbi:glycosyltransferase [Bacteroides acidifaciens]|jgi:Glycosyltransferases involved in cell wall biogenesis|uniref:glycosyltransferase n=1 Tax=Bacteroides acidifaciens TaxID=85831 RepID=UPI0021D414DA|nr:glycosyltransferase [Bacteroides acidifaciens]
MPKVSIIMATYNCESTLRGSIDSILHQSYKDWEFVICDDCSKDSTFSILKEYEQKYPGKFVILQNEKNLKLSFSLNHCLDNCKGDYIARMDGDDISVENRLERQVQFLDEHPEYALVGTSMLPFNEKGDRPIRYAKPEPNKNDMLNRSPFFHATIMMRKEAYNMIDRYLVSKRTTRAQDYDMWFRFFARGLKGYNLQEPLYRVLEDDNAIRRRTFKTRCHEVQTRLIGYRLLNYPLYKYIYAFKPILAAITPVGVMQWFHEVTDKKSGL